MIFVVIHDVNYNFYRFEALFNIPTTLLLQLENHVEDESVVVSMATDYWKILPLVNNYFRT